MKVTFYWYAITYPDGTTRCGVVNEESDTVQTYCSAREHYFEAEFYHLKKWCIQNRFAYQGGEMTVDLPVKD